MCLDDAISVMKDHVEGLESPSLDSSLLHVPPEDYISDSIPVRLSSSPPYFHILSLFTLLPLSSSFSPSPLPPSLSSPYLPPFFLSSLLSSTFLPFSHFPSLLPLSLPSPTFLPFSPPPFLWRFIGHDQGYANLGNNLNIPPVFFQAHELSGDLESGILPEPSTPLGVADIKTECKYLHFHSIFVSMVILFPWYF